MVIVTIGTGRIGAVRDHHGASDMPSMPDSNPHIPPPSGGRPTFERPPIPVVVMQHVEESAHLRNVRSALVRAPHVRLLHLGRLDERIAAHLDGVAVAGSYGAALANQALEQPGKGEIYLATVRAIEDRDLVQLDKLLDIAGAIPDSRPGLISAFGWVSPASLRGITKLLLESPAPWRREVGLAACALHGVDPGAVLTAALGDADIGLRARALRVAGRVGRRDLLDACLPSLIDSDPCCAFEAARSALLLGDRVQAPVALERLALDAAGDPCFGSAALRTVLKVVPPQRAGELLSVLAKDAARIGTLITGAGFAGDPHYVPWLIARMADPALTRLAGEAFSLITGLDLAYLDLDRKPPEPTGLGPNDDPNDDNVAMEDDDSLPWPDPDKIAAWWQSNGQRFAPGTRYFMGEPPSVPTCQAVLKTGFQRQRVAAAEYLCVLSPGTPLFNTAAPTWRQERLLKSGTA
jgi:uncharacterized protein (TIGR02270 family)